MFIALPAMTMEKAKIEKTDIDSGNKIVRLKCTGDVVKKNKSNKVVGDVFIFGINGNNIYDGQDKLIKNAEVTDSSIKGIMRNRTGMTLETTRFNIDRYTGSFNYYTTFTTLEKKDYKKNTGICTVIKNEKLF